MINAADLPAVRARAENAAPVEKEALAGAGTPAPSYPSKKLVLENGRYVLADPPK